MWSQLIELNGKIGDMTLDNSSFPEEETRMTTECLRATRIDDSLLSALEVACWEDSSERIDQKAYWFIEKKKLTPRNCCRPTLNSPDETIFL